MTERLRRSDGLEIASLGGIIVGLGVASYLTIVHYQDDLLVCGVGGDCHTVQSSEYATIGPIPVALLGVGLMLALLGLWIARYLRPGYAGEMTALSIGALVVAVAMEGYLTYAELFVIDAICQWCVVFAAVLLTLLGVEIIRFWKVEDDFEES